jgi:hypothetical protein
LKVGIAKQILVEICQTGSLLTLGLEADRQTDVTSALGIFSLLFLFKKTKVGLCDQRAVCYPHSHQRLNA